MSNYIYYDYMTSSVCKVKEDGIESWRGPDKGKREREVPQ